jgi:catechol 2,3-dioxygenase-like lactoylglutathione lyase family enzyme
MTHGRAARGTLATVRFDHVGILVRDLEAAKAFARDVLGLGPPVREFEAPEHGLRGAFFALGTGQLEVLALEAPGERLVGDEQARIDHVAVRVADLDSEQRRLAREGVRFQGPATPEPVDAPVSMRGVRHLWTQPATSAGFMIQLIEDADAG